MNVLETYLAKIAGEYDGDLPGADSRLTELLAKIAENSNSDNLEDTGWLPFDDNHIYANNMNYHYFAPSCGFRIVGNYIEIYFWITITKDIPSSSSNPHSLLVGNVVQEFASEKDVYFHAYKNKSQSVSVSESLPEYFGVISSYKKPNPGIYIVIPEAIATGDAWHAHFGWCF